MVAVMKKEVSQDARSMGQLTLRRANVGAEAYRRRQSFQS